MFKRRSWGVMRGWRFFAGLVEGLGEEEAGGGVGGSEVEFFFVLEVFFGEGEFEFFEVVLEFLCWSSFCSWIFLSSF